MSLPARIETKLSPEPTSGCWLWTGSVTRGGYGHAWFQKRPRAVHRIVYEMLVGPVPKGLDLDHLCRNRCCANPKHLEPVSHRENVLRGVGFAARYAKQTHCKRGHPLSGDNLAEQSRRRGRMCKQCTRASKLEWYHRNKGEQHG
jgi:hypothetical protein